MKELYAPFMRTERTDPLRHGPRQRGDVQVRRQRAAGDENLVHERGEPACASATAPMSRLVRRGVGSATRASEPAFLFPGVGYGGSCFPKDVSALVDRDGGGRGTIPVSIVTAVQEVNQRQRRILRSIASSEHFGKKAAGSTRLAVWGLAFKSRTDDVRESPAVARRADTSSRTASPFERHDPEAMDTARAGVGRQGRRWCPDAYDGARRRRCACHLHRLAGIPERQTSNLIEAEAQDKAHLRRSGIMYDPELMMAQNAASRVSTASVGPRICRSRASSRLDACEPGCRAG